MAILDTGYWPYFFLISSQYRIVRFVVVLNTFSIGQLVQPAFQSALGHIRSGTLDKFKEAFDKALKGGEGFSVAANNCIGSGLVQFDEACTGNKKNSLFCLLVNNKLKLKAKAYN